MDRRTRASGLLYPPPADTSSDAGLAVFLHGGGFAAGSAAHTDPLCQHLARHARCHVLSLDYRLAPECPFPAAVDDAFAALTWAQDAAEVHGFNPHRVAIVGESSGGNLAAVAAQMCVNDSAPALALQVLICPILDFRQQSYPSRERLAESVVLSAEAIEWFACRYLPHESDRKDPRASPIVARDLSGLAPAHVVTAAGDPLCDEGIAYAQAMRAAGVRVLLECRPSVHGFVSLYGAFREGRRALESITASIAQACGSRATSLR